MIHSLNNKSAMGAQILTISIVYLLSEHLPEN